MRSPVLMRALLLNLDFRAAVSTAVMQRRIALPGTTVHDRCNGKHTVRRHSPGTAPAKEGRSDTAIVMLLNDRFPGPLDRGYDLGDFLEGAHFPTPL